MKFRRFVVWLTIWTRSSSRRIEVSPSRMSRACRRHSAANAVIRDWSTPPAPPAVARLYECASGDRDAGRRRRRRQCQLAACVRHRTTRPGQGAGATRSSRPNHAPSSHRCERPGRGRRESHRTQSPRSILQPGRVPAGVPPAKSPRPPARPPKLARSTAASANFTTRRDLSVEVELCSEFVIAGDRLVAHGEAHPQWRADYMVADAQCRIRADNQQSVSGYMRPVDAARIAGWRSTVDRSDCKPPLRVTDPLPTGGLLESVQGRVKGKPQIGLHGRQPQPPVPVRHTRYTHAPPAASAETRLNAYWDGENLSPGPADQCFTVSARTPSRAASQDRPRLHRRG